MQLEAGESSSFDTRENDHSINIAIDRRWCPWNEKKRTLWSDKRGDSESTVTDLNRTDGNMQFHHNEQERRTHDV